MKEEVSFLSSPFQQKCDELSNITQSDAAAQKRKTPPRQPSNSSPKQTSLTGPAVRTVPVVHSDPSKTVLRPRLPERPGVGDDAAAKRLDPHPAVSQPIFRPPAANAAPTRSANALPSRKEFLDHRRGQSPNPTRPAADLKTYTPATHPAQPAVLPTPEPTAPPKLSEVPLTDYKFPVFDPPSPSPSVSAEAKKVYTPLDTPHRDESVRRRSTPRRSCLEDTPPPKTETGKKRRSPPTQKQHSPHEDYINEVMKRLDKMDSQRKGRNTRSSLVNEWSSWKEERASSRNSSVNGGYSRDGSVCSSAMSRDNSVSSISSRRASSPLPTKSNVEHAQLTPFQPKVIPQSRDNSLTRRHVYTSH
ncbi:hypothetical protein, conserved [Angomonas deanei]|uniref:Uncharacterized protein n=1 Tax=Angomonas deanei TaxID=59799 RepID=A0A7G2C1M8_9TRYP|nr:hypothetical protein, conserved [Angomonas deanei]